MKKRQEIGLINVADPLHQAMDKLTAKQKVQMLEASLARQKQHTSSPATNMPAEPEAKKK